MLSTLLTLLAVLFFIPRYHGVRALWHLGVPGIGDHVALWVRGDCFIELLSARFQHDARPVLLRVFLVETKRRMNALCRDFALSHLQVFVNQQLQSLHAPSKILVNSGSSLKSFPWCSRYMSSISRISLTISS